MAMDIHHLGDKKCYACIQWDGRRTYDPVTKTIKADAGSEGRCLMKHAAYKGTQRCDQFTALR